MASDQTLRAIITVLDKTIEPIRVINERVHGMGAPLRELSSRFSELAEETGLKAIGEHAGEALEHVKHLGEGLMEIAGPLAALGAAGSVAGLVEMAKSTGEFAEKLDLAAVKTGMSTESLSGWHYAAQLAGLDAEQLDHGITVLNRSIAAAAQGKAKDVAAILAHMGLHNSLGHMVGTADALKTVAAEAKHLVDGGQVELATAMMAKLFGARQGAELLPLFSKGPEELAKTQEEAKEAGISLTASQTAGGHAFMESYKAMSASVEGLKIAIGSELFSVLTPVVESMRGFLNENRAEIAKNIGEAVKDLAKSLKAVDWEAIAGGIGEIARSAGWLIEQVGGIGPAIGILATFSLAPTIMEFGRLGAAIAVIPAKLLLLPAGEALASIASLIPAVRGASSAWAAFNLVLDANPLGMAVLAAAALGAAAYEIYEHWGQIVTFFKGVGTAVVTAFEGLGQRLSQPWSEAVEKVKSLAQALWAPWSGIGELFAAMWTQISGSFEGAWHHIEPIVNAIKAASGWIGGHLGGGRAVSAVAAPPPALAPFGAQPPLPSLPGAPAAAGAAAAQNGQTKVTIDFKNLPPGASVSTESRGTAPPPSVNVGHAMALSG